MCACAALTVLASPCGLRRALRAARYSCVADVLLNFDIDICQVAWDGTRVLCTPAAMRAINSRVMLADPTIRHKGYESRLRKYALRGFSVAVPGLDVSRIASGLLKGSWATFGGELCRYMVNTSWLLKCSWLHLASPLQHR